MLKLLGMFFILFAGTILGWIQSARFALRPRQIRELLHSLQELETEIDYGRTPLPEALNRISYTFSRPLAHLFQTIARDLQVKKETSGYGQTVKECWEKAIYEHWSETAMKSSEQEALLRLGSMLGKSEREDQVKHIKFVKRQLQQQEAIAREDQRKYGTLSRALGMLGAALLVILMI